jgi:hypothetical protein
MTTVRELLKREDFFDAAILRHGFVDYMRDYEILVGGRDGPPHTDVHRYLFVGCAEAFYETAIEPRAFNTSLRDANVFAGPDYPEEDIPDGFVWGVRYANAYPGLTYVEDGKRAAHWAAAMSRPMHEVLIETEAYRLRIVFADVRHEHLGREGEGAPPRSNDLPIAVRETDRTSDGGVR